MKVALEGFRDHLLHAQVDKDKTLLILGDMNELGEDASKYHEEIGRLVKDLGFIHVTFVGHFSADYKKGFLGNCELVDNVEGYKQTSWKKHYTKFDYLFLKGSRSLQLESLIV